MKKILVFTIKDSGALVHVFISIKGSSTVDNTPLKEYSTVLGSIRVVFYGRVKEGHHRVLQSRQTRHPDLMFCSVP